MSTTTLPRRNDVEPAAYILPAEDFYEAKLLNFDPPVASSFIDKRTGEYPMRIRLIFEITEDDSEYKGVEVSKYCDFDMNALDKASIYHVLQALDPEGDPEGGQPLDDYLGNRCRIEVKHTIPKLNPKSGQLVTYANVGSVKPLRKKKTNADPNGDATAKSSKAPVKKNPLLEEDE